MKAAVVQEAGAAPVFAEFEDPVAGEGELLVHVRAAAISPLTKARAAGVHYSYQAKPPFVPGVDGVGRLDDGRRVYFVMPKAPFGSMAERVAVAAASCVPVPDALDDLRAAAVANPGMSSWAALTRRARLRPGETVLINGATGTSGRLAVQIAKHMGAGRIIVTGRNASILESLKALGADHTIALTGDGDALERAVAAEFDKRNVDVVLDYLWGPSAERIIAAIAHNARDGVPVRFVQIGSISGQEIALPGAALRAVALELIGSGIGSVPMSGLLESVGELLAAAAGFEIDAQPMPLSEVARAWSDAGDGGRTVLTL